MLVASAFAAPVHAAPKWTPLFNGRNLDNFAIAYASQPVDGRPATALFEVRNGEIHTYPGAEAGSSQASAYLQTRDEHADYVLHLEYKWGGKKFAPRMNRLRDAGIVFHIYQDVPNSWPYGVESQIEENDVGDVWLIHARADATVKTSAWEPRPDPLQDGTPYYAPAAAGGLPATFGQRDNYVRLRHTAEFETPGWNSVDLVVRGDSAVYLTNGHVNMRLSNIRKWDGINWVRLDHGRILFQAEYSEIFYRNIKIRPVTEADPR